MVSMRVVKVEISRCCRPYPEMSKETSTPWLRPIQLVCHRLDALGPVHQPGEVEQLVGEAGDAEEPLVHLAAHHHVAAALALAVEHLLVGQHRLAGGAPVYGGQGAVGQAAVVELEEEPLIPAVVVGGAGDDLPVPVIHGAHGAELAPHVLDVVHGPAVGVDAPLDGGVLGGQPEGVEPHGMEDVIAAHPHETGVSVRRGHSVPVADVQVARGVGVHGERVPGGTRVVVGHAVEAVGGPAVLPLAVEGLGIIAQLHLAGGGHGCRDEAGERDSVASVAETGGTFQRLGCMPEPRLTRFRDALRMPADPAMRRKEAAGHGRSDTAL